MMTSRPDQIAVMTGGTAGLGAHALARIASASGRVIVGARDMAWRGPIGTEAVPLDLSSLASVRTFASEVKRQLGGKQIDMLLLNGAIMPSAKIPKSADGFETTFAVNHLAHYLLARLLLPSMAPGSRLVITTSDTHDPAITRLAPTMLEPQMLAYPKANGATDFRAYPASKLCNLLTARSIVALDDVKKRSIHVIAYNPGLTIGTSLSRSLPTWTQRAMASLPVHGLLRLLSNFRSQYYPGTPERAGEILAQLALGGISMPPDRLYASLVRGQLTFPDPSELARSIEARDRLWRESAAMVGLAATM
ncbi:SDR family NAD(P)-dependent oxidoreductase [Sphingobium phenoxybenzoativorans]|uniref:SDR family NAD(P)-dependent oxidoreductase n=1 Tax=Sphingobium phenoxybenzoativorans TaxID=1592790 RepID=A0A975Q2Y6_9SPHN|nr:SDR family NAD(P)-dependent oxidoreductase [Sphingobium phenoxybenzoativorans]QUT07166.1 SDR family NAD(P)-dependent oxidoreductase [Sphingobium phenoxybenzoativorans]